MKLRSIKSWQIVCASLLLLAASYGIVRACAGGDWGESYTSNYTPEVFVADSSQTPFFYSWLFYYQIGFDSQHNQRFNDINVADWGKYLKGSIDSASLHYMLYKANDASVAKLCDFFAGKMLPDSLKRKVKGLDRANSLQKEFVGYLTLAKECETFAVGAEYYWEDAPERPAESDLGNLESRLSVAFAKSSSSFMKERYWFQLVRYYFFYNLDKCIATFENNKQQLAPSTMYYRAMAYAAGAYYAKGSFGLANYYYSRIYDSCNPLKVVAHASFHPQSEEDWQQTLAMCKSSDERITLWQLLGIGYSDEIRSMQEIYKLDTRSSKLDLLLTRFVNKQETNGLYNQNSDSVKSIIAKDISWCCQVADKGKTSNPFLWNVSAGYLSFIMGDYRKSASYYSKAAKNGNKTELATNQLRLLSLLTNIKLLNKITAADEQALLADLQWLYSLSFEKADPRFRFYNAQEWVKQELSKKYTEQGDIVKAECFVTGTSFYASNANVEKMKAYLQNTKPTAFDRFCMELSPKKLADLWEYQAIKAAYADSLTTAINLMKKAGETATLPGNPFVARISDCHDCDHVATQKYKYTKLSFLTKLQEIEDAIAAGKNVQANAFLAANAFYNMSHYGNARAFYEGSVIGMAHYAPYAIPNEFLAMLTTNKIAKKYYQIALKHSVNNEQKAKCLFMMAKCERNEWYNITFYSNKENEYRYDADQIDFIEWDSFKTLKSYRNTKFYKEVINECGYFSKTVNG